MAEGPKIGSRSPWGTVDQVHLVAEGIWSVSTAGHGGLKLDAGRNSKVPQYMRSPGGWYEEDCEWSIPVVVHGASFPEELVKKALETLRNWFPDQYQAYTGESPRDGESFVLDERRFRERHVGDYIARAAWGDWHDAVPSGMVAVYATVGGAGDEGGTGAYFLVPAPEYQERGRFGFVVDPARHRRIEKIN